MAAGRATCPAAAPALSTRGRAGVDPVTLRGYDSLGYGFDLWPAVAWQAGDAGFDPLRFDALRARLARRELAAFFAAALAAPR